MDPVSIISILGTVAPKVITWLKGDDAGEKAQVLVDAARKITGIADPEAAVAKIAADQAQLMQFQQFMLEHELEETRVILADIQSARAMQVAALQQEDLFSKRFAYYFAIGWSIFAAIYFFSVTFGTVTKDGMRFADTILGFLLGTGLAGIFAWLYGSTRRSAQKDDTTHALTRALTINQGSTK